MKAKGFTLIELAVVLAIISVLAAIMTPVVTGYLDQARIARASADARIIADALRLYQRDVGEYPIFDSTTESGLDAVGTNGDFITGPAGGGTPSGAAWASNVAVTSLTSYLNTNYLGRATTATLGRVSFRGPYLSSLEMDPWGNKYYITAKNLQDNSTNWGYVISAGPNGSLDTNPNIARASTLTAASDDIIAVVE